MDTLSLFYSKKEKGYAITLLSFVFVFHIAFEYYQYTQFKSQEVININATIQNIYPKNDHTILKLKNDQYTFFTKIEKEQLFSKLQNINLFILTTQISFLEYLKGFYTHSFGINLYPPPNTIQTALYSYINDQHTNESLASLYSALFLAINTDQTIRDFTAEYGISHLIAISGFHLGVMSAVLYFVFHLVYNPIHQKYFPFRNKQFDILIATALILFFYLILLDFVPSLLRAFSMLVFGLVLLRSNIKILSFETLFWIVLLIVAFFPKLLFSLSFWFSVGGVFYIFLFLHYFQSLNKYTQLLFFNFWIYLAMNPIVHYFFPITSYEQLISPFATIFFTLFYPLSFVLHLFGFGGALDPILEYILNVEVNIFNRETSFALFVVFIILSLGSIFSKKSFVVFNIALGFYSVYLFM